MSAKPIEVAEKVLSIVRQAQEVLATVENPAIRMDPAWEEVIHTIDRAERAGQALVEYGNIRPERLEG
ncbi:MAG: hypothetical protein P8K76_13710 [Candidatus Binatia bacterium]|jgi:hypothetical protein|nr:hypothetical protein [Candidatus Binatia bacterium]MDG2010825.1 hypothetical protein [Candidatus Binatia bacterium]HAC79845.1 hypothetical protein [Deltaproteobacteria bacterium]